MPTEFTTPVGRIVWGIPGKPRPVIDKDTKQPKLNAQGQPRQAWTFGVAFDKATFQQQIWPVLLQEAGTVYQTNPQTGMPNVPSKFAWKYQDGDAPEHQGKPGYAGCYVLAFSTELKAPGLFRFANGAYQQLQPEAIKCGDFVAVGTSIKANVPTDRTETPGLYVNPEGVDFVAYGEEIVSAGTTADPNAMFKGQQYQIPAGGSAMPIGNNSGVGMPGMGMQQPGGMPMQQPGMMPAPQPQMAPQPGYAPQPGMMPAPAPMMAPQPGMMPQQGQPGFMPGR